MVEFVNRRAIMKWAAALPLFGTMAAEAAWQNARGAVTGTEFREHLHADWRAPVHQCSRNLDVFKRISGTSRSPRSQTGSGQALRRHFRAAKGRRQTAG